MSSKVQKSNRFCGTCQHYCWTLGPQRKTTCNNQGCIDTTPACSDYNINPFVLQDFEAVLKPLADVLRVMPVTTISMFCEIIGQEKSLRRNGYYFMEKVAIKYWGTPAEQYVSNYIVAHVYSATKEGVFVIAKSGTRMYVLRGSVLKLEQFIHMRREMKEQGLVVDPTIADRASAKQKLAVTETLDDIIARGFVEEDDLDQDIKRKLNPKRINANIEAGISATELNMSTKASRKNLKGLYGGDEGIPFNTEMTISTSSKKLKKKEPEPAPAPPKEEPKKKASPFAKLKASKGKVGGKKK